MSTLTESMRLVRADCEADARRTEGMPLTGPNVGAMFGSVLAMVDAVAHAVEVLAADLESTKATLASRTDHLA